MKTFFFTLTLMLITTFVFSQDSLTVKSNSNLIKVGHKANYSVKQGKLLAFNSTNSLYSFEPNQLNPILPDFHVKPKTQRPSLTTTKVGYSLLILKPRLNSYMPIMVPDSTIKYHLKVAGSN